MQRQIVIGVAAGLASVVLFGSLLSGSALAVFLFYLAALPLLIAGLGWSWPIAGIGAVVASSVMAIAAGALGGTVYAGAIAAPSVWLSYLATLSGAPARAAADGAGEAGTGATEARWYPAGRLVMWAAVIGGALVVPSVLALGLTYETYEQTLTTMAGTMLEGLKEQRAGSLPDGVTLDDLAASIARLLPIATACAWMGAMLVNLYLAARVVRASGRLARPWPDLARIDYPRQMGWMLMAALAASFLPGIAGVIATAFAAVFILAYALLGLAVLHAVTRRSPVRIMLLAAVYVALILMFWPVIILTILGLSEPVLRLRDRHAPPPDAPPGNGRARNRPSGGGPSTS